ncbi:hypothetical protein MGYG_01316 [Nannizzia gypsea CBS 118893]|uniref:Uncharacterized protein n=1 Tax=Arthroderma gypseum (strain ATCC MYA-4604 / CBS 118893) TaxID=535722 RepID=E5R087_ARTGP|nr:hypothetical protein MGYG_01316 [Nannizzia gypsea CBS 118893]EFQ98283.1 hypothetical protein MGYG_01316 [Nannizzia gypsea CBS 118893]
MARTRSQPLSPSGYQMWQTPPRTRKQTAEAAAATKAAVPKGPKAATARVTKNKAKKSKKPAPKKRVPGSYDDSDDEHEDAPSAAESSTTHGNHDDNVNNNNNNNKRHGDNHGNVATEVDRTATAVAQTTTTTTTRTTPAQNPSPSTRQIQVLVPTPSPANGRASTHAAPSTPTPAPQTAARSGEAVHVPSVADTTTNAERNDNTNININGKKAPSQSEPQNISSRPIKPFTRRLPARHQPFSRFAPVASFISPSNLELSPTPIIDLEGGVTRNGERTTPQEIVFYPPPPPTNPAFLTAPQISIERTPLCPCCNGMLVCPSSHSTWAHSGFYFSERTKQLTPPPAVTGKRRREIDEDKENEDADSQPARKAKKRPAPKKPQRKTIKSREIHRLRQVTPYADRQRRRALESQGKIQRTLFRIPELIAQKKAAEAASSNENNNVNDDEHSDIDTVSIPAIPSTTELAVVSNFHSSPPQLQPSTPARTGWSFSGLLDSVPRSISRFLPFRTEVPQNGRHDEDSPSQCPRSTVQHENLSQNLSNETDQIGYASRTHENDIDRHEHKSVSASTHAVSPSISEEWKDTPTALPTPAVSVPVRSLAIAQPEFDEEDLSYDLFPRNHPLSSYSREAALRKAEEEAQQAREDARIAQEVAREAQEEARLAKEQARQAQETVKIYQPTSSKANANRVTKTTTRKEKKRKPIPNPPGCSYGMDLRYFGSTSSSEAESSDNEQPDEPSASVRPGVLKDTTGADSRTPARGPLRQRKQVRFGPSPPNVPSKSRSKDLSTSAVVDDTPESPSQTTTAQATPASLPVSTIASPQDVEMTSPSPLRERESDNQPRGQSTYGFTYEELYSDDFFDDIDEDPIPSGAGASSSSDIVQEVGVLPQPIPRGVLLGHSNGQVAAAPPTRPALATMPVPSFRPASIGAAAVERQMADMERFRPRLPSSLRTAERYSSSPLPASSPALQGVVGQGPLSHSFQWPPAAETCFTFEAQPSHERLRVGFRQILRQE